jgi:hypothetical protein
MMAMFLLLDKFWVTSKPKLLGASQHPDKGPIWLSDPCDVPKF